MGWTFRALEGHRHHLHYQERARMARPYILSGCHRATASHSHRGTTASSETYSRNQNRRRGRNRRRRHRRTRSIDLPRVPLVLLPRLMGGALGDAVSMSLAAIAFHKAGDGARCFSSVPRAEDGTVREEEAAAASASSACREEKCGLVGYDSLPEYLKDNEFILDHYRSEWPLKETALSVFSIHNETINIWTHLIGFFLFLGLTVFTAVVVPADANVTLLPDQFQLTPSINNVNVSHRGGGGGTGQFTIVNHLLGAFATHCNHNSTCNIPQEEGEVGHHDMLKLNNTTGPVLPPAEAVDPVTRWPFYAFLCGAMLCLLTSSVCHVFMCHSDHLFYVMLRLDYTGISTLIVTSFYPLVHYSFLCDPFVRNLYTASITSFGVAAVLASLVPVFQTPEYRSARAGLFFCMALCGLVPIAHKLVAFRDRPEAVVTTAYEMAMGVFYGAGVVVYATRVPERWLPGWFDLAGHSHQLFHVLVVAGAYTHYLAGLVYLQWRDLDQC